MPDLENEVNGVEQSAFDTTPGIYGKKTKTVPKAKKNVGIDTNNDFYNNIVDAFEHSILDVSSINSFSQVSTSRDSIYSLLDNMCEDSMVSAILETYVEDATETNDQGKIVWAESNDSNVVQYVSFLLDSLNVNKYIFGWTHCLVKYGDVYLRLFRESDVHDDSLFDADAKDSKQHLNEAVKIKAYSKNDHYINYIEMHPNPAEIFELTKYGKAYAYVKTSINSTQLSQDEVYKNSSTLFRYRFKRDDVFLYAATEYVHGCLEDTSSRTPEVVNIFLNDQDYDSDDTDLTYTVRRGESIFYDVYRIWRSLALLENSILLNRVTKSSIVRIIGVEVGDMGKEQVQRQLMKVKSLIEQKAAIDTGNAYNEYTNPGPIENNVYVPTHGGVGTITTQQIGGDVNVGQLADLDYFRRKFFGACRVPQQYFGYVEDNAGFSGGQSLSLISSRYAKLIKRIQKTMCQVITDAVNLILIDRGLDTYVGQFTIRMQAPTTQEEVDRLTNTTNKVTYISDVMNILSDVDSAVTKLKIAKAMLATVTSDNEVIQLIQDEIDKLEADDREATETAGNASINEPLAGSSLGSTFDMDDALGLSGGETVAGEETGEEIATPTETKEPAEEETILPTPEEIGEETGLDFSDNTQF